ncbi:MAG: penicillin-binding transpeptidase domain-containing protein, partial [Minisyncoccales bacterium]
MFLFKKKIKELEIDLEETFLDFFVKQKEKRKKERETRMEIPIREIRKVEIFFSFLTLFLFLQLLNLQFLKGSFYQDLEKKQNSVLLKLEAERGIIFDRRLIPLVENEKKFNLLLDKKEFSTSQSLKETIKKLSDILGIKEEDLWLKINNAKDDLVEIYKNLDQKRLILIESEKKYITGIKLQEEFQRFYPQGKYFSHLLGYLRKIYFNEWEEKKDIYSLSDKIGAEGIEKEFEEFLRTQAYLVRMEKNVKGELLEEKMISLPQAGKNIVLTIDNKLQNKLAEIMEKHLEQLGLKKGAAVLLNPNTGEILALLSFPLYDNNIFSRGDSLEINELFEAKDGPLFNRALKGQYPIGSVIKPFLALAGLEEGLITEKTTIDDTPGFISIPHPYLPGISYQYRDWRVHGLVD